MCSNNRISVVTICINIIDVGNIVKLQIVYGEYIYTYSIYYTSSYLSYRFVQGKLIHTLDIIINRRISRIYIYRLQLIMYMGTSQIAYDIPRLLLSNCGKMHTMVYLFIHM